jgi:outer membrane protein TolC
MTKHTFFSKFFRESVIGIPAMLIIALMQTTVQADDSLTVNAAVAGVLARHPQITQAAEALASIQSRIEALNSPFYPTVNGALSYSFWGPNDPLSFGGKSFNLAPTNMLDAHVDATYTIYDFGKRKLSVQSGTLSQSVAEEKLRATKQALSYQVIQLFHMIILLEKSILVKDDELASLNRHLSVVQRKVETGSATEFDVLKTQIQQVTSQGQRIDLVNDRTKKMMLLRQLLGLSDAATPALKGSIERKDILSSADSLVNYALNNRTDMAILRHAEEQAKVQLKSAEKENLPSLGCRALVGFKNGILPNIQTIRFNWSAGAQFTIPIYDGNRENSHKNEAEHAVLAASADISAAGDRIKTDVLQTLSDVTAAQDKIVLSATQEQLAGQCLIIARAKYDAGVITNVDLLDSERDFAQAQIAHLQTQYVYTLNRYLLDQAIGKPAQN